MREPWEPKWANHPGNSLRDWLEVTKLDEDQLAIVHQVGWDHFLAIVDRRTLYSDMVAELLGDLTGTSGEFWRNRRDHYVEAIVKGYSDPDYSIPPTGPDPALVNEVGPPRWDPVVLSLAVAIMIGVVIMIIMAATRQV